MKHSCLLRWYAVIIAGGRKSEKIRIGQKVSASSENTEKTVLFSLRKEVLVV
jgi:hypothetical protein